MSDDDGSSGGSDIDSVGLIPSDKEGVSDAESVVRTPNVDDDDSSDDEPLSVLKQDVKKRLRSQNRDEDEELALAESNSEDESRRDEFVRDYSREGDLEMLHMPRATFPFPSYIRQAANQLDPHRHPLAATPLKFLASQNLQLVLSRHAPLPLASTTAMPSGPTRKRMASVDDVPTKARGDSSKRPKPPPSPTTSSRSSSDDNNSADEGSIPATS
ncbi:hypothetical protein B5M09_008777 [Aphanomyces astaci]|uniref:Uncharacterized protein n=1 Tax=Aphanomyces astaci TaxID=112090 RepID=A0A3R7Z362_APHAT|nr:hypothetical protein B5M09_008777 [Aphanomyces astaci]